LQVWGELAIMFISLLSSVYPQAASPSLQDAAAADTSPLKHALFSLFSQVLDVILDFYHRYRTVDKLCRYMARQRSRRTRSCAR
jgi:hypothetical protein